ncbi:MAG: helix-turn-helix domain-containing protein [Bdellovibrionaceae bacterium]|nr:helix-turn-helix domain-containing protein [Pseudobdellovibrionaceae bacterium]
MSSRWILRMRVAWVLWTQRLKAGLSLSEAASLCQIPEEKIRRFEIGLISPPLCYVARMLTAYNADDDTILFFCCQPSRRLRKVMPQLHPLF